MEGDPLSSTPTAAGTLRRLPMLLAGLVLTLVAVGCGQSKKETFSIDADPESFPTMKTLNVSTLISDSGYTRYHITTPLWLMFEEAKDPHWDFPDGLFLLQFDNNMVESSSFTADTARYFSARKLWKFDRNVKMRNVQGDRFMTQQLFWDQTAEKLYSDSFIHIERADRIIEGYGFISNQELTSYTIRQPSGIFPTSDFRRDDPVRPDSPSPADSASATTDKTPQP